jgi:RES domain-containing protein
MSDYLLYRALNPQWSFAPLSGAGAAYAGGRWNAKGTPALYLAFDAITALLEYNQSVQFHPVTLAEYHVTGARLADLTQTEFLDAQGIASTIHQLEWRSFTLAGKEPEQWTLAKRFQSRWYDGVIYRSMRNPIGTAVCLWNWNAIVGPCVEVFDSDRRLPRDQSSWRS